MSDDLRTLTVDQDALFRLLRRNEVDTYRMERPGSFTVTLNDYGLGERLRKRALLTAMTQEAQEDGTYWTTMEPR